MIEEIFKSVNSYSCRSRTPEGWDMVFNHLHSALLCINTQEELIFFKENYFSYIDVSCFRKEHPISVSIQLILNQKLHSFEQKTGLDSFKEKQTLFSTMVEKMRKEEEEKSEEEWQDAITHSKRGGMWPAWCYID